MAGLSPVDLLAEECAKKLIRLINKEEVADITLLPVRFVDGGTTK